MIFYLLLALMEIVKVSLWGAIVRASIGLSLIQADSLTGIAHTGTKHVQKQRQGRRLGCPFGALCYQLLESAVQVDGSEKGTERTHLNPSVVGSCLYHRVYSELQSYCRANSQWLAVTGVARLSESRSVLPLLSGQTSIPRQTTPRQ